MHSTKSHRTQTSGAAIRYRPAGGEEPHQPEVEPETASDVTWLNESYAAMPAGMNTGLTAIALRVFG